MIRRRAVSGFTLIEIMVTLAILGTALVVLMASFTNALELHESTLNMVQFRNLFEWAMGEAEVGLMMGETSGGGECGKRYPGYMWSYTATVVDSGAATGTESGSLARPSGSSSNSQEEQVQLFEVEVTVTPAPDSELKPRSMTFLVFNNAGAEIETEGIGGGANGARAAGGTGASGAARGAGTAGARR